MKEMHKVNIIITWACVVVLIVTTILSYGNLPKTYYGSGVVLLTGIIVTILYYSKVDEYKKALGIVLIPSYAVLIYSASVNGNTVAFMASYITLGMAVRYFNKKLIKWYAIPYIITAVICGIVYPPIIDGSPYDAMSIISKISIYTATCILMYSGTAYGEKMVNNAKEMLNIVENNKNVVVDIAKKLNTDIVACADEVGTVNAQAAAVKESTGQMEDVVEETSKAIIRVNDKIVASTEQINKNYEYAADLGARFKDVNVAVEKGDNEAKIIGKSMVDMSDTVSGAKEATLGLLGEMDKINEGANAATKSAEKVENLLELLGDIMNTTTQASEIVDEEFKIIEGIKQKYDEIQDELETVVATSEENSAMIVTITESITSQTEAVFSLNDSIGNLKKASEELHEHFNE